MTTHRKRRRTTVITLVLIASVCLKACGTTKKREVYRSLDSCRREWGQQELCEPILDGSYPMGYYYGPYYRRNGRSYYYYRTYDSSPQLVPSNASITKTSPGRSSSSVGTVTRGGFGKSGMGKGKGS